MRREPNVRSDGRCSLSTCRKPRKITVQAMKYAGENLASDPWCSSDCCRKWWGAELPETPAQAAQKARYTKELAA